MIPRRISRALRGLAVAVGSGCLFGTATCVQTATDTLGGGFGVMPPTGLEGGGLPIVEFDPTPTTPILQSGSNAGTGLPGPLLR